MRVLAWLLLLYTAANGQSQLSDLPAPQVIALHSALQHVQGIDVDEPAGWLWVSSVDRENRKGFLHLFDLKTGTLLRQVEAQEGDRFHPGGIALDGDTIWVPVAEYRRSSSSIIQQRRRDTLVLIRSFNVDDHIGCVAVGPDRLYGGNWDARQIYEWSRKGKQLARRDNPTAAAYQDWKFVDGMLAGGAVLGPGRGAIDWLDPGTLRLAKRMEAGVTDRKVRYTNEGMALRDGRLYLLPEDGPSRLFVFRLSP